MAAAAVRATCTESLTRTAAPPAASFLFFRNEGPGFSIYRGEPDA